MAFSLMNGLSTMGASIADYAGRAGLEAQKADLLTQQTILADKLATTRESAGRAQAGDIAAKAAGVEHGFLGTQGDANRATQEKTAQISAGATLGAAGIHADAEKAVAGMRSADVRDEIAAADPLRQAQLLEARSRDALQTVQTTIVRKLSDAHTVLQAAQADPNATSETIRAARDQIGALEYSSTVEAANNTAATALLRVDQEAVSKLNDQIKTATIAYNTADVSDPNKEKAKADLDSLTSQLRSAQITLRDSSQRAHAASAAASGGIGAPSTPANRAPITTYEPGAPLPNPNAGPRANPSGWVLPATPGPTDPDYVPPGGLMSPGGRR